MARLKRQGQDIPVDDVRWYVPELLLEFIQSTEFVKVTHSLDCEDAALENTIGTVLVNAIDIRDNFGGRGLAYISARVFGYWLDKSKQHDTQNGIHDIWHVLRIVAIVSDSLIDYAAMDAWITLLCYIGMLVSSSKDVTVSKLVQWARQYDPFHDFSDEQLYDAPLAFPDLLNELGGKRDDNLKAMPDFIPDCDDETGRVIPLETVSIMDEQKWWVEEHFTKDDNVWRKVSEADVKWFVTEGHRHLRSGKKHLWPTTRPRWIPKRVLDRIQEKEKFPQLYIDKGTWRHTSNPVKASRLVEEVEFISEYRSQDLVSWDRVCACPGGEGYLIVYNDEVNVNSISDMEEAVAAQMNEEIASTSQVVASDSGALDGTKGSESMELEEVLGSDGTSVNPSLDDLAPAGTVQSARMSVGTAPGGENLEVNVSKALELQLPATISNVGGISPPLSGASAMQSVVPAIGVVPESGAATGSGYWKRKWSAGQSIRSDKGLIGTVVDSAGNAVAEEFRIIYPDFMQGAETESWFTGRVQALIQQKQAESRGEVFIDEEVEHFIAQGIQQGLNAVFENRLQQKYEEDHRDVREG